MQARRGKRIKAYRDAGALHRPRADHGPRERWQHSGRILTLTEQAGVLAARATEEHVLDRLVLAGIVSARARDAGLRLRADYQAGHLEQRIVASYSLARDTRYGGFAEHERDDAEEAAYRRWRDAVRAVGMQDSTVVLDVACHDMLPRPTLVPQLRRGLERLADWYKI